MLTESCLLLIDLQLGFLDPKWGRRNNPGLEANITGVLRKFRSRNIPVIHVRHDSMEPGSPLKDGLPGFAFIKEACPLPGEKIFTKRAHSAFVNTALEVHLRKLGLRNLILAGLTTDHCVSTTMRMAFDLGFVPVLLADVTATFNRTLLDGSEVPAETVHELALASLHREFGWVTESSRI